MGAGMKGFASLRGSLEMTGEEFFLVVSNGGTRQQVSFMLEGKGAKGLRKYVGQHAVRSPAWSRSAPAGAARVEVENFEPRPTECRAVSRDDMEVVHVDAAERRQAGGREAQPRSHGAAAGARRLHLGDRAHDGQARGPARGELRAGSRRRPATREFFFTPRNPGTFEVEFFLAKAFTPAQVAKTFKLHRHVKP